MITFTHKGNFKATERFLKHARSVDYVSILERYGQAGVDALAANTPVDTGKTASSWSYEIEVKKDRYTIYWTNSNIQNGVPIAVILQYGHATNNGGFVQGRDYINPALQNIFDSIAENAWREVKN